jgi:hypothetical protein
VVIDRRGLRGLRRGGSVSRGGNRHDGLLRRNAASYRRP